MKELNKLTEQLFAEGYTKEYYPGYIKEYNKYDGGFQYKRSYSDKLVFETRCGLQVKGSHWSWGDMSYMGINWTIENDNPTIVCPFREAGCKKNNPLLTGKGTYGEGVRKSCYCECHKVEKTYNYEKSVDREYDLREKKKEEKYKEFEKQMNGRICRCHMHYDEWTETWFLQYDPMDCPRYCNNDFCAIHSRENQKKRGNVFYDLKIEYLRRDGTLFDGEKIITIEKGMKLLPKNVSLSICAEIAKSCVDEIQRKINLKYHHLLFFNKELSYTVQNVRAEQRESRDLMQDFEDIKAGIIFSHYSDIEKNRKKKRTEKRVAARKKAIAKLERKIIEVGYDGLIEYSLDWSHAKKWLSEERIQELGKIRREKKEAVKEYKQMSLFDNTG